MLLFQQHRWLLYSTGKLVLAKFYEATNAEKTCRIFPLYIF